MSDLLDHYINFLEDIVSTEMDSDQAYQARLSLAKAFTSLTHRHLELQSKYSQLQAQFALLQADVLPGAEDGENILAPASLSHLGSFGAEMRQADGSVDDVALGDFPVEENDDPIGLEDAHQGAR